MYNTVSDRQYYSLSEEKQRNSEQNIKDESEKLKIMIDLSGKTPNTHTIILTNICKFKMQDNLADM